MENCDDAYGFPPYPLIAEFLHTPPRRRPAHRRARRGRARSPGSSALLLRSTTMDWWQRVPLIMALDFGDQQPAVASMPVVLPITVEGAEQVA